MNSKFLMFFSVFFLLNFFSQNSFGQTYECDDVGIFNDCYINALGASELSQAELTLHPGEGGCVWDYYPDDLYAIIRFTVTQDITDAEIYAQVFENQYVGIWLYESGTSIKNICDGGFTPKICNIDDGTYGYASVTTNLYEVKDYMLCIVFECASGFEVVRLGITNYENSTKCSGPLPVQLIWFNSFFENNITHLEWTTASEINNDFFTIEKSLDAINWRHIGTTPGHGNSNQIINYNFVDTEKLGGIQYYRLKQTDYDGKFEYSQIKSVDWVDLKKSTFEVYPNPTNGLVKIKTLGQPFRDASIKITNTLSQLLIQTDHYYGDAYNIDMYSFSKGIYILEINLDGEISRIKIQKE